ncbi:hypothetical protein BKA82DRAFT_1004430 [Pisolithus tinctorius]|uniref:Uncharacterized protein n=1 Tax=Pisolithus tinctorius Marx 270 TaxID=870435 RepID=A0A0C3IS17_PISTI|nr:hypothetical protein BKA82DRAFT_1004430 [Pisolithus tinctorius]KIN99707.1 hypothetical protein M404DRAFT_1004430 [Pisolithus tinctorius Marx 270]
MDRHPMDKDAEKRRTEVMKKLGDLRGASHHENVSTSLPATQRFVPSIPHDTDITDPVDATRLVLPLF